MRELLIETFEKPDEIWPDGTMIWRNEDGQFHRENDLPAVIYDSGSKFWYKNGQYHRDNDLPAIIYANGTKCWYKNGQRHQSGDKPAVIYNDDIKEWWKNGKYIKTA